MKLLQGTNDHWQVWHNLENISNCNSPLKYSLVGTKAITHILKSVDMEQNQFQLGKSKVFIKDPASVSCMTTLTMKSQQLVWILEHFLFQLFLLEETRDRKFDSYARMIQKAFRKHFSQQMLLKQKEEAAGKTVLI